MRKTVGWVSACRATELGCCGSHLGGVGGQECVKQKPATDLATSQQSRKNELSHRCVLDALLFISACMAWLGWVVVDVFEYASRRPDSGAANAHRLAKFCHATSRPTHFIATSRPIQHRLRAPGLQHRNHNPPIPANHHVLIRCNPGQVCRLLRFTQPGHDAVAWFNPMSLTLHT